jgi:Zinc-finger of C2H2 type
MAGDHKCTVCQATFTRPQHVSRHMRSRKPLRPSSSRPAQTSHRYRRSPIQVSALWRPVRQKVCPPPSSISRCPTHLHFTHFAPLFFFASDLLSRHVNKCHPNEKPLVSSTPSRRKGTSSTSRATTSKQACDQCVQSTLPCDGANPCCK